MMRKVSVDFNARDVYGRVRCIIDRSDGPLRVGDTVHAYDGEGPSCEAVVSWLDSVTGVARLRLDMSTWNDGEDHEQDHQEPAGEP